MAILKKIKGLELYLYMNGSLIYKRWLNSGSSKVFDIMAYDKYTLRSIKDIVYKTNGEFLTVKARLKLKSTEEGGRQTGCISGYRPNHVFAYKNNGQLLQTYVGDIIFEGKPTIEPGEEREVTIRFLRNQSIEMYLGKGRTWWIHDGESQVGEVEII